MPTLPVIFFAISLQMLVNSSVESYICFRTTVQIFDIHIFTAVTTFMAATCNLYADDRCLVTHTTENMWTLMDCISVTSDEFGLIMKPYHFYNKLQANQLSHRWYTWRVKIKVKDTLIYIGSTLTRFYTLDEAVGCKGSDAYYKFGKFGLGFWSQTNINRSSVKHVF